MVSPRRCAALDEWGSQLCERPATCCVLTSNSRDGHPWHVHLCGTHTDGLRQIVGSLRLELHVADVAECKRPELVV
jgi:hypothetical protein